MSGALIEMSQSSTKNQVVKRVNTFKAAVLKYDKTSSRVGNIGSKQLKTDLHDLDTKLLPTKAKVRLENKE